LTAKCNGESGLHPRSVNEPAGREKQISYHLVDHDIIWSTVTENLPQLIGELEKIL